MTINVDRLVQNKLDAMTHASIDHETIDGVLSPNEHGNVDHSGLTGVGRITGGTGIAGAVVYSSTQGINNLVPATSITINGGVILNLGTGAPIRAVHFQCSNGNFVNGGTINGVGSGIQGGTNAQGTQSIQDALYHGGASSSGGDGGGTTANSAGGRGTRRGFMFGGGRIGNPASTTTNDFPPQKSLGRPGWVTDIHPHGIIAAPGGGGGAGDDGVNATAGNGGRGGGLVVIEVNGDIAEGTISLDATNGTPAIDQGGGDGGGGGGGGGGMLLALFTGMIVTGTVTVAGGSPGGAAGTGNGALGGPGEIGLIRRIPVPG